MSNATDIIFQSIVVDQTKKSEILRILRGCNSTESKAAAVRGYCGKSLENCLTVEKHVVTNLLTNASWEDIVTRLDEMFSTVTVDDRKVVVSPIVVRSQTIN